MIPPIFTTVSASSAVTAIIGTNPVRLYAAGYAPQNVAKPYATYQVISGSPENYLNQVPDHDEYGIQIDCFAQSYNDVINLAKAIRDSVEPVAHITAWRGGGKENETMLYRYSFDVAWQLNR